MPSVARGRTCLATTRYFERLIRKVGVTSSEEVLESDSLRQKSTEVEALKRLHNYTLIDACLVVGLDPLDYRGPDVPLEWLPSPEVIESMVRPFREAKQREREENSNDAYQPRFFALEELIARNDRRQSGVI